ncbi:hypothetical protein DFH06DRAFT_768831 [Mycena polygramma]|nr:hypothetical protein DFH06DRAFT_768831 [Mycena polygramma]
MPVDEVKVHILRRKIEEVNAAIKLRDERPSLEQVRSRFEGYLNGELDPMTRLPLELSSDILLRCLPAACAPALDPYDAPMVFLSICRSWTRIALSQPALWTGIQIQFPRAPRFGRLVDAWLHRAHPRETSISMRGTLDSRVGAVVQQHAQRVRNLELSFPSAGELPQISSAHFSSLKVLTIAQDNVTDPDPPEFFSETPKSCIQMMMAAPGLVECTFDGLWFGEDEHDSSVPVIHHSLRHLNLGVRSAPCSATPLQYLTLPALRDLYVCDFDIDQEDFLFFLTRSAPPMQSLSIPNIVWTPQAVDLFTQFPSLTDLRLSCHSTRKDYGLLEALATRPDFLPNLRILCTIRWYPDRARCEQLVRALSARRASQHCPIQSFRLQWTRSSIDVDIMADLRRLAADGMQIHVDNGGPNLI